MSIRAMVLITGRVQGVSFRHHTMQAAKRLGVTGWVRNLADGSVQGCFEGERSNVEQLIQWCNQGPSGAAVTGITVKEEAYAGEFESFHIRY